MFSFVVVLTVQRNPHNYFPNAPLEIPTKVTTVQVSDYISAFIVSLFVCSFCQLSTSYNYLKRDDNFNPFTRLAYGQEYIFLINHWFRWVHDRAV